MGSLSPEAVIVEVCKYMGWDYYTYMNQPQEFIETILARMQGEGLAREYFNNKYASITNGSTN